MVASSNPPPRRDSDDAVTIEYAERGSTKPWMGWKVLFWLSILGFVGSAITPLLEVPIEEPLKRPEYLIRDQLGWFTIRSYLWDEYQLDAILQGALLPLATIGCWTMIRRHPVRRQAGHTRMSMRLLWTYVSLAVGIAILDVCAEMILAFGPSLTFFNSGMNTTVVYMGWQSVSVVEIAQGFIFPFLIILGLFISRRHRQV